MKNSSVHTRVWPDFVVRKISSYAPHIVLTVCACTILVALTGAANRHGNTDQLEVVTLQPSVFVRNIKLDGVIEPLKSDVVSSSCYWTTNIISLVPEGTWIKKGEIVCVLDSSDIEEYAALRERTLIKYQSRLDTAIHSQSLLQTAGERKLTDARFKAEAAQRKLTEYAEATFPQQVEELERDLSVISERCESAEDEIRHSERMWVMGIKNHTEMDAELYSLNAMQNQHSQLHSKLNLLTNFTHPLTSLKLQHTAQESHRNLTRTQLGNELSQSRAQVLKLAYEKKLQIYKRYHQRAVECIEACTLRAPSDGRVVYANSWYLRSHGITQIEEGNSVRYLQKVFEIPDPSRLKVSVPLKESLIYEVARGMSVTVHPVSDDSVEISGRIHSISRYPRMRSSYTPGLKDYWLEIELLPTTDQRGLLTPKADVAVSICLQRTPDTLQIPRGAVTGIAGQNFVYVLTDSDVTPRCVKLGAADENNVCVVAGLDAGEQVVTGMLPDHKAKLHSVLRGKLGLEN